MDTITNVILKKENEQNNKNNRITPACFVLLHTHGFDAMIISQQTGTMAHI